MSSGTLSCSESHSYSMRMHRCVWCKVQLNMIGPRSAVLTVPFMIEQVLRKILEMEAYGEGSIPLLHTGLL